MMARVGKAPVIRQTATGRMASFSVATDHRSANEYVTDWHDVVAFDRMADAAEKVCQKGALVLIEGSLNYNEWTGQDGVKRKSTQIYANTVRLAAPPKDLPGDMPDLSM